MRKLVVAAFVVALLSFVLSIIVYPNFPSQVASHWNYNGAVDGYSGKFVGLFIIPIATVALLLILYFIVYLDPLKENIDKFIRYYDGLLLAFALFMTYINGLVIEANLINDFNMVRYMVPAFALLFFYIGVVLMNTKRNWVVGIRTPWALTSDEVWERSHKFAGKVFMIGGVISLIGTLFVDYAFWFIIVPILAAALIAVINSYFEFRRWKKKHPGGR